MGFRLRQPAAGNGFAPSDEDLLAMGLFDRRKYPEALKAAERALRTNRNDPIALAVRGNIYLELKDYDRAIADHDTVLRLVPEDADALTNACWARALAGIELDAALGYCNRALVVRETRAFATLDTRAFLHLRRNEHELAVADYDAAIAVHRKLPTSLYGRGIAKLNLGRREEGQADIDAATKLQKDIAIRFEHWGIVPPTRSNPTPPA